MKLRSSVTYFFYIFSFFRFQALRERAASLESEEREWQGEVREEEERETYTQNNFANEESTPPLSPTIVREESERSNVIKTTKKVRGRPKKIQEEARKWSDEETFVFIELWSSHDILFNPRNPRYHIRDENAKALEAVRTELHNKGMDVSVKQIQNKFLSLKSYFSRERGKINASRKSGAGADEVYDCKWKFFKQLSFLDEHMAPRHHVSNILGTPGRSDNAVTSDRSTLKSERLAKNRRLDKTEKLMETAVEYLKQPQPIPTVPQKDDDDVFSEMISRMLKVKNNQCKDFLKLNIQQLILQATYNQTNQQLPTMNPQHPTQMTSQLTRSTPMQRYQSAHQMASPSNSLSMSRE